ncbi:MAG: M24 family metallopeptidase, partial [Planctomycetota bacterium]
LREAMTKASVDALLIAHPTDIRYLTSFGGDDSLLLVAGAAGDAPVIITDARHDELLDPWRATGIAQVVMGTRHRLEQSALGQCKERSVRRLGIQAEHLTLAGRRKLAAVLGDDLLVETEGLVGRLRMRKDEVEIAAIERAAGVHQEAIRAALNGLSLGMTELELCAAIEYEMKVRGASGPSFGTMVSAGAHSSIIHHVTGPGRIEPGTLLIDWGAIVDGYCSDMTRTFGVETFPKKVRELYDIVLEAQLSAIDACAPGQVCAEIDAVARGIIVRAGYGEHFGHGLGHGLGLDIHEDPYFNDLETDIVLEPGMVMTVEPGIYLPGVGGVRIEDDVLITDGGCRVLTDFPKDPESAVIDASGTRPDRVGDACHA